MRKLVLLGLLLSMLILPVKAAELTAPAVPPSGRELMPDTQDFSAGLSQIVDKALSKLYPEVRQAVKIAVSLVAATLIVSIVPGISSSTTDLAAMAGAICICSTVFFSSNTMIRLGRETVTELAAYGKLLFPVLATALAAQGALTTSGALYAATAAFDALLSSLIDNVLIPMVYLFLGFAAALAMTGEEMLKQLRDLIKTFLSWCLKTLMTVFTTYLAITGVVSGTTDAAALKAAKVTISSVVPVVGGILSDASEAVLVSAGLAKNAAGIYGIFAIAAVFLTPFLKIGLQYLMLKASCAVCSVFGPKRITELLGDFATAMGMILSMTGACCLLQLISTVCFLRGAV